MKKLISILAIVSIAIAFVFAVHKKKTTESAYLNVGETDHPGVEFRLNQAEYPAGLSGVSCLWINREFRRFDYGSYLELERLEGESWYNVAPEDAAFAAIAYPANPLPLAQGQFQFGFALEPGRYRLSTPFYFDGPEEFTATAYFTVTE